MTIIMTTQPPPTLVDWWSSSVGLQTVSDITCRARGLNLKLSAAGESSFPTPSALVRPASLNCSSAAGRRVRRGGPDPVIAQRPSPFPPTAVRQVRSESALRAAIAGTTRWQSRHGMAGRSYCGRSKRETLHFRSVVLIKDALVALWNTSNIRLILSRVLREYSRLLNIDYWSPSLWNNLYF